MGVKMKDKKRTIIYIVIIMIVAALIYYFTGCGNNSIKILGDLDPNSFDKDVVCIKIEDNKLKTVKPNYDGDEYDRNKIKTKDFKLADNVKVFDEFTEATIDKNNKEESETTYTESHINEMIEKVEEGYGVTMRLWLDKEGKVETIMTYGKVTIWE